MCVYHCVCVLIVAFDQVNCGAFVCEFYSNEWRYTVSYLDVTISSDRLPAASFPPLSSAFLPLSGRVTWGRGLRGWAQV